MSDWFVETTMLYGAVGGAAFNLVVVSAFGSSVGTFVTCALVLLALAFEVADE